MGKFDKDGIYVTHEQLMAREDARMSMLQATVEGMFRETVDPSQFVGKIGRALLEALLNNMELGCKATIVIRNTGRPDEGIFWMSTDDIEELQAAVEHFRVHGNPDLEEVSKDEN